MTTELQSPPPPALQPSAFSLQPSPLPLSPRAAVAHKLCERLDAAFGRYVTVNDPVSALRMAANSRYLVLIIAIHFKLPPYVAEDIQLASKTIGDLADKICETLNLPAENLF